MYVRGEGVPQDDAKAAHWFQQAVEQRRPTERLEGAAPQDAAKVVQLLQDIADRGHIRTQIFLGLLYAEGNGVPQDDAKAVQWLERAARGDVMGAQIQLGVMYATGRGVARDDAKAVEWYKRAVAFGSAMENMLSPARERSVPKDEDENKQHYLKILGQALALAHYHLGEMYLLGRGVPGDRQTGCGLLREAAKQEIEMAVELYDKACAK
jgi:TPR repeat protein